MPTVLIINFDNPWIINTIEPDAAAVLGTFSVKGEAFLDVVYGRFNPTGKLLFTIPADLQAVEKMHLMFRGMPKILNMSIQIKKEMIIPLALG